MAAGQCPFPHRPGNKEALVRNRRFSKDKWGHLRALGTHGSGVSRASWPPASSSAGLFPCSPPPPLHFPPGLVPCLLPACLCLLHGPSHGFLRLHLSLLLTDTFSYFKIPEKQFGSQWPLLSSHQVAKVIALVGAQRLDITVLSKVGRGPIVM